jgi:hypothetical protein
MARDLTNPLAQIVAQAAKTLPATTGSTASYAERRTVSLRLIVADVSGSMASNAWGGRRKIDILRETLIPYTGVKCIAFSSGARLVSPIDLPEPDGGTNLRGALIMAAGLPNITDILVVSDGQPDDENAALRAASALKVRIDALYIGPDTDAAAINFMRRLAMAGSRPGQSITHDLTRVNQQSLSIPVSRLLGGPK